MPKASTLATSSPATVTALKLVLGVTALEESQTGGQIGYATKEDMDADLAHDAGTLALVTNDETADNNGSYRKEGASGAGEWVQADDRVSNVVNTVSGITGGATVSDQQLKDWTEAGSYEATSITRNSNGVCTSATVKWPDGSAGTFTATTVNTTFNAIDAYTITHTTASRKVTQTAVTRNTAGEVTAKPALTVGAA